MEADRWLYSYIQQVWSFFQIDLTAVCMCAMYAHTHVCVHMLPTLISEFSVNWELAGSSRLAGQ